ncbi:hypothetical protein CCACVL1_19823 [Corchorus capsularis]|uniref:Uncharacterized protein n=1 Tax=Corchorus capsularis TaxID=210143 RepID=A0A1R3HEP2_COCAP|nr:hypothetical protein CCACVL1_19823 [Corchorus capsularis]
MGGVGKNKDEHPCGFARVFFYLFQAGSPIASPRRLMMAGGIASPVEGVMLNEVKPEQLVLNHGRS